MPLAFESLSHGTIAFGFFNIDSDMLLLERYFFFATDFCSKISDLSALENGAAVDSTFEILEIGDPMKIGDLMGAIRGIRHTGFIGDTYLRYPFPRRPEDFKQRPQGHETRAEFEEMIAPYSEKKVIPVTADSSAMRAEIGSYAFGAATFHELLDYVWRGGYPRWKDEKRPDYVSKMRVDVEQSNHWLFRGVRFS